MTALHDQWYRTKDVAPGGWFYDQYPRRMKLVADWLKFVWSKDDGSSYDGPEGATWRLPSGTEVLLMQLPGDLIAWIELINRYAPRVIIETGTCGGSTTAFLADCLRRRHADGRYRVVTVEINAAAINPAAIGSDPNIVSIVGNGVDPAVVERVKAAASLGDDAPVMVTLDSDHEPLHVCREIEAYASCVTIGQHLVVQDTRLSMSYNYHHGPLGAVEALLTTDPRWEINFFPERFPSSQYPFGWLRRNA